MKTIFYQTSSSVYEDNAKNFIISREYHRTSSEAYLNGTWVLRDAHSGMYIDHGANLFGVLDRNNAALSESVVDVPNPKIILQPASSEEFLTAYQRYLDHGSYNARADKHKEIRFKELLDELCTMVAYSNHHTFGDLLITDAELEANYQKAVDSIPDLVISQATKRSQIPKVIEPGTVFTVSKSPPFGFDETIIAEIVSVHDTPMATVLVTKLLETNNSYRIAKDGWIHACYRIAKDPASHSGFCHVKR